MRILVITPVYPPYKGGMGTVAAQEAGLMQEAGHKVRVITPRYKNISREPEEEIVRMDPFFAWGNAAILHWRALWREIQAAEVIHLHYPFFGTALLVACMTRVAKKRLVVSFHMRATAERGAWLRALIFWLHRSVEEPLIMRLADVLCASSQEYQELLHLPEKKTVIIPFGVDLRRFQRVRNRALREEQVVADDACVFLFVGGMDRAHAFKGIPVLLNAFAKMHRSTREKLWLVGDGDMRETYTHLAHALNITDSVTFWGGVPSAQLPLMYQAADVHVLPSVSNAEAYGLVICEAAASGIPSIVSKLPGVQSLVDHEKTGLHVPPGNSARLSDALIRLASNKEEREVYGSAAFEKITTYATLHEEQRRLLRVYMQKG